MGFYVYFSKTSWFLSFSTWSKNVRGNFTGNRKISRIILLETGCEYYFNFDKLSYLQLWIGYSNESWMAGTLLR